MAKPKDKKKQDRKQAVAIPLLVVDQQQDIEARARA